MQKNTSSIRTEQNVPDVEGIVALMQEHMQAYKPTLGIVLGTGLGGTGACLKNTTKIPYTQLPRFPLSTVVSHAGNFLLGTIHNAVGKSVDVILQQGRCHLYEGYSPSDVCTGVRVMAGLGIKNLIITNVAGSLNPLFDAGSIMAISDHINFTGHSPLTGANHDAWGERFPDMGRAYDANFLQLTLDGARTLGIPLERGVYVGVVGPQLETPAETRFLRHMGADAVGMSTVLEVIAARHMGLRVLGLSCLVNKNLPDCMEEILIDDTLRMAALAEKRLTKLIQHIATEM